MIYDSIIIGKGPAGITTAVYLKRYGYEPLIIAKDGGALVHVKEIENYYGFSKITGPELLERGIKQANELQIPILEEEVLEISFVPNRKVPLNSYHSGIAIPDSTKVIRLPLTINTVSLTPFCLR